MNADLQWIGILRCINYGPQHSTMYFILIYYFSLLRNKEFRTGFAFQIWMVHLCEYLLREEDMTDVECLLF